MKQEERKFTMNHNDSETRFKKWYLGDYVETTAQWIFILFILAIFTLPPMYGHKNRHQAEMRGLNDSALVLRTLTKKEQPIPRESERLSSSATKIEQRFDPLIHKAATRYDVDPALVKAIIKAESEYNPKAISKRGAKGLMQLMPGTARALGVEDCFNPEHNIDGGVKYFKKLLDRFNGNVKLGLAAYNAGAGKVRRYGGVPPFRATRYYIEKVFKYYSLYRQAMTGRVGTV